MDKHDTTPDSHVLLVVGMHRSGTSFLANWLNTCGLYLGEKLIPADPSNPAGHYEDETVSHFQRGIFRASNLKYLVTDEQIAIEPSFYEEAQAVLTPWREYQQWGWKDPRTTLLLDFWHEILPQMHVILIYRPPHFVVDSLLRRDIKRRFEKLKGSSSRHILERQLARLNYSFANVRLVRHYGRVWQRYNEDALAFVERYPAQSIVVSIEDVLHYNARIIELINQRWGFSLSPVDVKEVYQSDLLTISEMRTKQMLTRMVVPSITATLARLATARQATLKLLD